MPEFIACSVWREEVTLRVLGCVRMRDEVFARRLGTACICIYVCVCMYVCIYICMYVCMCFRLDTACICIYVCVYVYAGWYWVVYACVLKSLYVG